MVFRKFILSFFLICSFFSLFGLCSQEFLNSAARNSYASFVLKKVPISQSCIWTFYLDGGFLYKNNSYAQSVITLANKKGVLFLNDKKINQFPVIITPRDKTFYFEGFSYRGSLVLEKQKDYIVLRAISFGEPYEQMHQRLVSGLRHLSEQKKVDQRRSDQLYHVRVLLAEHPLNKGRVKWQVSSPAGFGIVDLEGKEQKLFYNMRDITISAQHGQFFINETRYASKKFLIVPREGHLSFDGGDYHGNFIITLDWHHYYLINSLDIEDYVFSVLRTETWPGWPLEINKVCAIASRTYVVGVICNNRKSALPYHVKNTTAHQTYRGIHPDATLRKAVQETHGIFLAHNEKPIVAMFDAVCGGVIPGQVTGVNFHHAPYLKRTQACNFCKNAKGYRWSTRISEKQMVKVLQEPLPKLKQIKDLKITKKDKAGVVHEITVLGTGLSHGHARLNGKQCYFLFKPKGVRSFNFAIKRNSPHFFISGKGIGHHMGLCQWGAREMVNQGYDYKKILQFYYPGTSLMRFY